MEDVKQFYHGRNSHETDSWVKFPFLCDTKQEEQKVKENKKCTTSDSFEIQRVREYKGATDKRETKLGRIIQAVWRRKQRVEETEKGGER